MQTEIPRVLVVEDERLVARDLQQLLGELGYDAYATASSADEALSAAAERLPDLVLMDIRLKGDVDGIAAAHALERNFDVPVVYLTAHADDATIERARASRAYGYLIKPVDAARLRSAIEVGLHKHRDDRKLRERERWLETMLRSIADGMIAVDAQARITFMNGAAEAALGLSQQAAQGRALDEVFHSSDATTREVRVLPLDVALRDGKPVALGMALLSTKRRGDRAILANLAPVTDGGRVLGAVLTFRDVTELKQAEKQLEAADRLASLGTMAAGVAHEVNNPLLVVTANATLAVETVRDVRSLLGEVTDPGLAERLDSVEESISDVHSAALRIGRVVSDLRGFVRTSDSGEDRADVGRCVNWAVRTTTHELRQRAQVEIELPLLPEVRADEVRLGQVLINLLLNAAQSIDPGQASGNRIGISAEVRGDEVVIAIADTGTGIAPEVLPRIFDPFFTTKPFGVGTGLGLSICHAIVSSTGGKIEAESALGKGSVFRVHLPVVGPNSTSDEPLRSISSAPRRARILVVDDETIVLKAVRRILENQHEVVCAESGTRGLELIDAGQRFDLVFCDLMMPDMNGIAFYERLAKGHEELARRVVFLTGAALTPKVEDFLTKVRGRILEKPFDAKRLRQVVASLVMGARW